MKVLITGGCGFIGTNLSMSLFDKGWKITVIDRDISRLDTWRKDKYDAVDVWYSDYSNPATIARIKNEKFDVILHQAAVPRVSYSVEHPAETTDENIGKMVHLLEAAAGNCGRFVFASSSSVYGMGGRLPQPEYMPLNPISPYALQKKVGEEFVRMFCELRGLDALCLRYFNVFGPHQYGDSAYATALSSWCHRVKSKVPLRKDGTGEQSRDLCFVDNVVQANYLAAIAPGKFRGEAMNIACGDRTSNNEILAEMTKRFPSLQIEQAPFRVGDIMHTQADISLAKEMIGYEPIIRFWDGFERTLKWWEL